MPFESLLTFLASGELPKPPRQYTLETPLAFYGFTSGEVPVERAAAKITVANGMLKAYGAMQDSFIFNKAVKDNDKTWETGDVFELFFQPKGHEDYYEAHGTPEQIRLQLHIQDYRTFRGIPHEQKICDIDLQVKTQVYKLRNLWLAELSIPLARLGLTTETVYGSKFAFARYNYPQGDGKPVVTSTQVFPKTVHFPSMWHTIIKN